MTCSFCGKTREEVTKLVASDKGTAICDECVVVAVIKMMGSGILTIPKPTKLPVITITLDGPGKQP